MEKEVSAGTWMEPLSAAVSWDIEFTMEENLLIPNKTRPPAEVNWGQTLHSNSTLGHRGFWMNPLSYSQWL